MAVGGDLDIAQPVRLLAHAIVEPDAVGPQTTALTCLNDLLVSGWLSGRHVRADAPAHRFTLILRALDGWLAGASYREIAVALFGKARVDADWADPGRHLRDRVRRAVMRGRTLMKGGYLELLR